MATASYPWADGPLKLIPSPASQLAVDEKADMFIDVACEMVCVHNCIIRGLNAVYQQAPHITSEADQRAFLGFVQTLLAFTDIHHRGEEAMFFPKVEEMAGEPGVMSANVVQHEAFHDGLEELSRWTAACLGGASGETGSGEKYSGARVRELIDAFGPALATHLADEIPTLVGLRRFGTERMAGLQAALGEDAQDAMSKLGLSTGMVFCLATHDRTYEGGRFANFPPLPWALSAYVRYGASWQHADWWRFAPCDVHGQPRALYATASGS